MNRAHLWIKNTLGSCVIPFLLFSTSCQNKVPANEPTKIPGETGVVAPAVLGSASSPATQSPLVNAAPTSGGFGADAPSTGLIKLHWTDVPGARGYVVFKSTTPVYRLDFSTVLTMDTTGDPLNHDGSTNHWTDGAVVANTRYYYAVVTDVQTQSLLVATGSCATPAQDGPLKGIGESASEVNGARAPLQDAFQQQQGPRTTFPSSQPIAFDDEVQREQFRKKDGVTLISKGTDNLPGGSYGFSSGLEVHGGNIFSSDDGEHHDDFEIHRLADGKYSILGYVDPLGSNVLKKSMVRVGFNLYSHRSHGAIEIVDIPVERIRMNPQKEFGANVIVEISFESLQVTMDGFPYNKEQRVVGNSNRMILIVLIK